MSRSRDQRRRRHRHLESAHLDTIRRHNPVFADKMLRAARLRTFFATVAAAESELGPVRRERENDGRRRRCAPSRRKASTEPSTITAGRARERDRETGHARQASTPSSRAEASGPRRSVPSATRRTTTTPLWAGFGVVLSNARDGEEQGYIHLRPVEDEDLSNAAQLPSRNLEARARHRRLVCCCPFRGPIFWPRRPATSRPGNTGCRVRRQQSATART